MAPGRNALTHGREERRGRDAAALDLLAHVAPGPAEERIITYNIFST